MISWHTSIIITAALHARQRQQPPLQRDAARWAAHSGCWQPTRLLHGRVESPALPPPPPKPRSPPPRHVLHLRSAPAVVVVARWRLQLQGEHAVVQSAWAQSRPPTSVPMTTPCLTSCSARSSSLPPALAAAACSPPGVKRWDPNEAASCLGCLPPHHRRSAPPPLSGCWLPTSSHRLWVSRQKRCRRRCRAP